MSAALVALGGAFGLLIGSFVNVVIYRVPRDMSVGLSRSRCPACGGMIRAHDNIPLVSWVLLRRRCRDCRAPISARYPLVEALTGVLFAAVVARFVVTEPMAAWAVPAFWYLSAIGVALALIDLEHHRLPNSIVLPSYPVLAALLTAASWASGDWAALVRAVAGGAALWLLYFGLLLIRPGGMGFGDVKLAGIVGAALAWLGWGPLVVGAFGAFLTGGLVGLALIVAGRAGRATRIPFGPWMLLGAVLGVAVGESAWSWYLSFAS